MSDFDVCIALLVCSKYVKKYSYVFKYQNTMLTRTVTKLEDFLGCQGDLKYFLSEVGHESPLMKREMRFDGQKQRAIVSTQARRKKSIQV